MMKEEVAHGVNAKILHRDWHFKCNNPKEQEALLTACLTLDHEMQKIHTEKSATGYDQIAVLAALRLAYYAQQGHRARKNLGALKKTLQELRADLADELSRFEKATPTD